MPSAPPPPTITEYQLPRPNAFPHDPAVGADGIVWYTDQNNSFIGRLDPATGKITDIPTPTPPLQARTASSSRPISPSGTRRSDQASSAIWIRRR